MKNNEHPLDHMLRVQREIDEMMKRRNEIMAHRDAWRAVYDEHLRQQEVSIDGIGSFTSVELPPPPNRMKYAKCVMYIDKDGNQQGKWVECDANGIEIEKSPSKLLWKLLNQKQDDTEPMLARPKCECGSGSNDLGPHHSHWCVLHKVYKDER